MKSVENKLFFAESKNTLSSLSNQGVFGSISHN